MKRNTSKPIDDHKKATLAEICSQNEVLRPFYASGLGAMKKGERQCVKVPDTQALGGSVALDEAARRDYPHDNRWDYAIAYDGNLFFIEVHPGSTSEIECMIQKVKFVKSWLRVHAPEILDLPKKKQGERTFYWVSSGSTDLRILPGSQQARKMALHHIKPVGRVWDYSRLFKD